MKFHIGDQVIHWTYGLGKIVGLEEKFLSGNKALYYVVRIRDMTLWVRTDGNGSDEGSLRQPTPGSEFNHLFDILRGPAETLSDDRLDRRLHLQDQMRNGKLEGICRVVRDLTLLRLTKKLNDYDKTILDRDRSYLITEWELSLAVTPAQAELELALLLGGLETRAA